MNSLHNIPREVSYPEDMVLACRDLVKRGYTRFKINNVNSVYIDCYIPTYIEGEWITGVDTRFFAEAARTLLASGEDLPPFDVGWFE